MGLSSPNDQVRRLRGEMRQLAAGEAFLQAADQEIQGELKSEFARGEGPYGRWQPTKRGRQALESKKLPQAFSSELTSGGLRFSAKTKRDMLLAHQEGHAFPARAVAANKQYLNFNSKGSLVAERRIFNRKKIGPWGGRGELRRGGYQRFARAHQVSQRVLPERKIIPEGTDLPPRWAALLERSASRTMMRWHQRAAR